tara:strand:- start:226 stop:2106 length:1881 start_codon:yes stop_codon:yes gene_type:complete
MANLSNINGKFVVEQTTGFVGIGTTDPAYLLHVNSSDVTNGTRLIIENTNGSGKKYGLLSDNTGVFTVRDITAGADRFSISTLGNATFSGNITGTTAVFSGSGTILSLNRNAPGTALIELKIANTIEGYLGATTTKSFVVYNEAGSEKAHVENNGNIGLYGSAINFLIGDFAEINFRESAAITIDSDNNQSSRNFQIKDGSGSSLLTVLDTGNVGIGTTSPGGLLTIKGTGDAIRVESTNTGAGGAQIDLLHFTTSPADNDTFALINMGGYYTGTTSVYGTSIKSIWTDVSARNAALTFSTNNAGTLAERMRITNGGQVQVGYYNTARGGANTTFMTGKSGTTYLELNGGDTSGEGGILFADGSGGNYGLINYSHVSDLMQFYTASAERMRITSEGTTAIFKDAVETNFDALAFLRLHPNVTTTNSFTNIFAGVSTSNNYGVSFGGLRTSGGSAPAFSVRTHVDSIIGTERMRIESDGTIRAKTGSIVVDTAGQGIYLGGTAAANNLNYYASGTWTPTVTTSQLTSPTITSSSGRWQRVGKVVTASFEFTMSNPTVGAGSVIINNLPIAFADNQHVSGCGVIGDLGKTINVRYYTGTNQIAMNFYDGNYCGTAFRTVGTVTYWAAT